LNKQERSHLLHDTLKQAEHPVSGARLAKLCGVSRQIIIKDIAAMRKEGIPIQPTAAGYLLAKSPATCIVACRHSAPDFLEKELFTVIEGGGTMIDVFIEHPRYGRLRNELMLSTQKDIAQFLRDMESGQPLCSLTDGLHMHTLSAPSRETLDAIVSRLAALGILVS